jgi:site-specific recombinase XerD
MSKNWPAEWGKRPNYVTAYRGKPTFQRRKGSPRVVMSTDPRDRVAFEREHLQMMAAAANGNLTARVAGGVQSDHHRNKHKRSLGDLATQWRGSTAFQRCKLETQRQNLRYVDRILTTTNPATGAPFAHMLVPDMMMADAIAIRNALPKPSRSRCKTDSAFRDHHMRIARNMFHWGLGEGGVDYVNRNPFARLKPLTSETELDYAWRPRDWEKFATFFPVGSMQHLAIILLRYLGVRVSDLADLGADNGRLSYIEDDDKPGNKTGKRIHWVEYKNRTSQAKPITKRRNLKVHPVLWATLKATPGALDRPTFLVSRLGGAYQHDTIGEMFNRWCVEAGLPDQARAHGVRRGTAQHLAHNGASLHQIKAFGGWRALSNVQRYTRGADDGVMGDDALDNL